MQMNWLTKIARGQDGAIYNGYLFRFQLDGSCHVYDLENLKPTAACCYQKALCVFDLDKTDGIVPHSNSVCFGTEYYVAGDEFPLLYSNVYNNYACQEDQRKGMCCVYRVHREGNRFWTTLVQVIRISFTEDTAYWCSPDRSDARPYGNFVVDQNSNSLLVLNMIDRLKIIRYFDFDLPRARDGVMDTLLGVPVVTLTQAHIRDQFDCPYQNYIQGVCCHNGVIYSLEGLAKCPEAHAVALISVEQKKELHRASFFEQGLTVEPELIDFKGDICYYADNFGNLYTLEF